ncbi:MAG: hypothetical protein H0T69_17355 [Thermoleophilaceae bacterium]|nr:hypothetical protein [Thermoleophilaceae bacterium]
MRRLPVSLLTGFLIAATTLLPAAAAANPQQDAIDQLNEVRQANGLTELRASSSLHRSSTRYARQMIDTDYFGHATRIAVSSRFGRAGETLALQPGWGANPAETMDDWMNSPVHRAVLLSPGYRWIGMGIARGRVGSRLVTVWVAQIGGR